MSSDVMPPLFLTEGGLQEAIRIFNAFRAEDRTSIRVAVDRAVSCLSAVRWPDYDDTYLSLYTLSLLGHGKPMPLVPHSADERVLPYRGRVEFMLNLDLTGTTNRYELLDERGVALFINFKKAIEGLVPFPMLPRTVGFGCIFVEFDVLVPRLPGIVGDGDGQAGIFAEGGIVRSFFSGHEWDALTKRFNIADVAVHGLT